MEGTFTIIYYKVVHEHRLYVFDFRSKYVNKTSVIKKIIGNAIKEYGFEYIRCDQKIVWIFGRIINDVEEHIIIKQHKRDVLEYKLMFSTTAKGNGRKEIGSILPEYKENEYWKAESDKEFEATMCFFAEFIKDKGISILDDMLEEKPDSFETPERKMWFKEHRSELISKYEERYHILAEGSSFEQVCKIDAYDKTIFVLNQDITDQAIRFAVTRPHRTKVVTCRNTYSLSSMISNWLV